MSQNLMITVGLLGVGFILSLTVTIPLLFRLAINTTLFLAQIKKLIAAHNIERAIKLCNMAGQATIANGTKGMLLAWHKGSKDSGSLHQAFDQSVPDLYTLIKKLRVLGFVALACLALAVIQVLRSGMGLSLVPEYVFIGMAAVLLSVVVGEKKLADTKRDSQITKDQVTSVLLSQ